MINNGDYYESDDERQNNDLPKPSVNEIIQSPQQVEDLCTKVIPMYNRLVDVLRAVGDPEDELNLPRIVVVGSQSVGKSSVLESLVSRQFLPRGDGLVTRCPIELRLHKTNEDKEWAQFGHDSERNRWPLNKVAKEISDQTNRLAGNNKGIVDVVIRVSVYSPHVVPLTVVDLPGIVKNSTGDQPVDIEDQINKLIYEHISKPSTIILAISAANNDIANSESLKLARRVDESGERTLGVITKIDKADRDSEELKKLLSGELIHLQYGFIGVRNYCKEDTKEKRSIRDVRDIEEGLLNELVPRLASENGTKYLQHKLSQLLMRHICKRLPSLENKIAEQTKHNEATLETLGSDDIPNKSQTMSTTIHRFCTRYNGEFEGRSRKINTTYVNWGAKVKFAFLNKLETALAAVDPLKDITDDEISKAILSSMAMESSVNVPEAAYQHLVKFQIKKLLPPCLECVRNVHLGLQLSVDDCLDTTIASRFPRLTEHLVAAVHKFLSDRLSKVTEILEYHIEIESAYISTSRQDFRAKLIRLMADKNITDTSFAQSALTTADKNITDTSSAQSALTTADKNITDASSAQSALTTADKNITDTSFAQSALTTVDNLNGNHTDGDEEPEPNFLDGIGNTLEKGVKVVQAASLLGGGNVIGAIKVASEIVSNESDGSSSTSKIKKPIEKKDKPSQMDDGQIVRNLIKAYFEIVRQSIRDYVPKLLTHSMIYYTVDNLQVYLIEQLHSAEKIDDLVRVSADASRQRVVAREKLEKLKKGAVIIKQMREDVTF